MNTTFAPEGYRIADADNRKYLSSLDMLERAAADGVILEATALLCDNSLSLHFRLGSVPAIMEKHEVMHTRQGEVIKDIAVMTRVGKPTCFKIMGITYEDGKPLAVLSRRLAQQECAEVYLAALQCGDIIPARVTHLESFGAFVDVGCGIASLLSVDSISVSRISHPSDRLAVGNRIYCCVKAIDAEHERYFVSMRELLGTWEENAAHFSVGQTVIGTVRSVESYGVFVELAPNLAGLAELREGTRDKEIAKVGQTVAVYIKNIIPDRMKIKLVLIDAYRGDIPPSEMTYYVDGERTSHLSYWRYSPVGSAKVVETVFDTVS